MQIRLTVLAPRGGSSATAGRPCDVLVTAPAGTALAAVASGLAAAVSGPETSGTVVLYAGQERLDPQRRTLGEPPLVDGAVLALQSPVDDDSHGVQAPARLHVVAGPDAGGVHLLHGGRIGVGRSADADVPLDDPDVSRLHCAVTVTDDGRVTVADLGSTNGTTVDGASVDTRPVRLPAGALLRLGESTLRLTAAPPPGPLPTTPDGEGHLRVSRPSDPRPPADGPSGTGSPTGGPASAAGAPPGGGAKDVRIAGAQGAGPLVPGGADGADGAQAADGQGAGGRRPRWAGQADSYGATGAYTEEAGPPEATTARRDTWPEAPGSRGPRGSGAGSEGAEDARGAGSHGPGSADTTGMGGRRPGWVGRPDSYGLGADAERAGAQDPSGHRPQWATDPHGTGDTDGSGTRRSRSGPHAQDEGGPHWPDPADPHGRRGADDTGSRASAWPEATDPRRSSGADAGSSAGGWPEPAGPHGQGDAHGAGGDDAWGGPHRDSSAGSRSRAAGPGEGPGQFGQRGGSQTFRADGGGAEARGSQTYRADATSPRVPAQYDPMGGHTHARALDASGGEPVRSRAPEGATARRRGIGAWARRLTGGRDARMVEQSRPGGAAVAAGPPVVEAWPDPATVLLTALGPGPRLWERGSEHPESLVIRLGTTDRAELPAVPVTVALREAGSLGLAGPRARLAGLARSAVAQLAALHSPSDLEIVLISTDRSRSLPERLGEWAWLGWLPHLRPAHGQDCRLLLAYDRDQATARAAELTRRLDEGPLGQGWPSADHRAVADAADRHTGPRTVVIVDGDPGSAALRETTARLAGAGPAAGIHLICLAETPAASPLSPVAATYESACAASPAFRECGGVAMLSGDVATALRLMRVAGGRPVGHGTVGAVDAVSPAWAERFARALAPLRSAGDSTHPGRVAALPQSARLLDELELARATPASLMARWATAGEGTVVLGAGPRGPLVVDLTAEGPHLLIEGPAGSGRTELLRAVAASLAAAARPDRLGLLLVDGTGGERGEGLAACTELPHVTEHLVASDPVRMRVFAQALGAELKRRTELLDGSDFAEWQARREAAGRIVGQRVPSPAEQRGDLESPPSGTLRLRPGGRTQSEEPDPLPRLVVLVDDFDALVAPALGSPGRPAAGSVVRALEAVAKDGERLGVHLVATSSRPDRTADTRLAEGARLRVVLQAPPVAPGPDDPAPGRGRLGHPDGRVTPFQSGRVTGRIPRTATLRPTVVPLEWERMGDPPTRRPVRELGNGPTDLALLASALQRAAQSVNAGPVPPLTPAQS
ncbi:FHA domain-containing protein [Streptomyces sp. NPDC018833]|uniref:FHA domain-containing protein n=1 Tax=Streptomyces sp. NPDC018833 TaxID=3365053 RepID=UPI0037B31867